VLWPPAQAADRPPRCQADVPSAIVIDCTHPPRSEPARNHNDLNVVLEIRNDLGGVDLVLTHIGHAFDAWHMQHPEALPASVSLARDGTTVRLASA